MAIILAAPKEIIDEIKNGKRTMMFWKRLPYALQKYSGTDIYCFTDNNTVIYLCNNNETQIKASIHYIYNLHYCEKTSSGLTVIKSRLACANSLYNEWCKNEGREIEDDWITCEAFEEYLKSIQFYDNYAVKLKNIEICK